MPAKKTENNAIEKNLQAKEKVTVPTILLPSTSFKSDAEHKNIRTNEHTNTQTNEQMNKWTNEQMEKWKNEKFHILKF
jgi:hypothetical protein